MPQAEWQVLEWHLFDCSGEVGGQVRDAAVAVEASGSGSDVESGAASLATCPIDPLDVHPPVAQKGDEEGLSANVTAYSARKRGGRGGPGEASL